MRVTRLPAAPADEGLTAMPGPLDSEHLRARTAWRADRVPASPATLVFIGPAVSRA
jgi:hypothetical protein